MKNSLRIICHRTPVMLVAAALAAAAVSYRADAAGVTTWSGAGANQNWSNSTNWATVGGGTPPAAGDSVFFKTNGAAAAQGIVNNIVDTSFTIGGLTISNDTATTWHTTQIPAGNTLTVNGPIFVGGSTFLNTNATFTGGGTLLVAGPANNFTVATVGTGTATMCLDLSQLTNFVCDAGGTGGAFGIGLVNPSSGNSGGTLNLAAVSNNITASTMTIADNNNGTCTSILNLGGGTNIIDAGTINIGWDKCNATVQFYTNTGSLMLRNAAGTGGATINIGDNAHGGSASGNFNSRVNLTGHYVDMMIGTLELGNRHARSGGGHTAYFSFDTGVVNCTTINMAINLSGGAPGNGYFSVGGGTLNVGSISLVNSGGTNGTGSLTITNGGLVNCTGTIFKTTTGGTGAITNYGGTLSLASGATVGSLANTVDFMTLSNATLVLGGVNASTTNIFVGNLDTENGGVTTVSNFFSIGLLPGISSFPAYFHIILYTNSAAGITDAGNNFQPVGISPQYTCYITNYTATVAGNTVGFIDLAVVSGPAAKTDTWQGTPTANWNTSDLDWLSGGNPANFNQGDFVAFDDTAPGSTTVNLPGTLEPTTMTVNNTAKAYTFNGPGSIGGITTLVKQGPGALLFDNSASNTFSGAITLGAGTIQLGNGDANGNLGTGPVANNGALVIDRTDVLTMRNAISGGGGLTNIGTGTFTVAGVNSSYTGAVMVAHGTLKLGASTALGTTDAGVLVASGAVLDLGGNELTNIPVTASGAGSGTGAIINSGPSIFPAITRLTLAGNITLGGSNRWDLRSLNTADSTGASLSTSGNAYNIIKVSTNTIGISGVNVDPALGNIDIQQGLLTVESATTSLGNPADSLTVELGATLQLFQLTNLLNKVMTLNGNGTNATLIGASGANTVVGPITLNGSNIISAAAGASLTLAGPVGGSGSLTEIGGGYLILGGNNTYGGATTVTNGTLAINGINSGTSSVIMMTNTTIVGTGTNIGPVTVGGELNPGDVSTAGTLTVGTLAMSAGATTTFDLNPTTTMGGGVNDLLQVNGNLTLNNNTVTINLLQGTLAAGTYRLVNYTGTLSGSFNPTVNLSISGSSRYTLALNTSTPGQINLVVTGSAASLVWDGLSDNTWDVGTTPNWLNTGTAAADNFYQGDSVLLDDTAGVQTALNLTNTVAPSTFTNNSGVNNFSISGPGKITGPVNLVKMGSSTLMLGSANDFSGTVRVLAGTLQVSNNAALGSTNGPTMISSGATLDLAGPVVANSLNLGLEPIIVSGSGVGGNGAIINSSTTYQINATRVITLAGDTTFGGPGQFAVGNGNTAGRWDMRGTGSVLSTGGHPYNLTKVGRNQMSLVGVLVDTSLNNIDIQGGMLGFEQSTTSMGNPAANLTIEPGADLELYQGGGTNYYTKQFILNGDGATTNIDSANGLTTLNGTMTLNNGCAIYATSGTTLSNNCVVEGSGSLTLGGSGTMILTASDTYSGNTTIAGAALLLNGTASISNSPNINLTLAGSTLNVNGRTDRTLTLNSQNLTGIGTVVGNVTAGPNSTITPGNVNNTTLTISGNLVLNSSTNAVTLGGPNGDNMIQTTNLTLNGVTTLIISAAGQMSIGNTHTVIQYSGTLTGGLANLQSVGLGGFSYSVVDPATTPGSIQVTVTAIPANFVWRGGVVGFETNWDTIHTNWYDPNLANTTNFASGVLAQFDDQAVYTNINLVGALDPLALDLQNYSTAYTFLGSGQLTGSGGLTMEGSGGLVIANTGINTFSGDINVLNSGYLQIGNGATSGNLGTGNINTTNGYLVFDHSDNINIANNINGNSQLTNSGPGVLTLSGNNTLSGVYTVAQGTLQANNNLALGGTRTQQGTLILWPGSTLDLGGPSFAAQGENLSNEVVVASGPGAGGAGAIINSSTNSQFNALRNVMAVGDLYLGGPGYWLSTNASNPGRWDIRGSITNSALVTSNMLPYSLYKIGSNHVGLVGVSIDNTPGQSLGNIYIEGGKLQIESGTTSLGDINSNLTISAGATLGFYQSSFTNNFVKNFILNGNGSTVIITNESGTTTINGAMAMSGGCIFGIGGTVLTNNCSISGAGSLVLNGAARLVLSNTSIAYTGNTTVSNGTLQFVGSIPTCPLYDISGANAVLDVSGAGGTLAIGSGQAITGGGTLRGSLSASGSATVAVGEPGTIATLTVTNTVALSSSGTTTMKLSRAAGATNDLLKSTSTTALGGTLNVTLLGGTLQAGDTFALFKATGGLSGTFSATNLPALSTGLAWVTTNLVNGIISVAATVNTNPTNLVATFSGNTLTLTWPMDHTGWRLLAQTNSLANGLSSNTNAWVYVTGSSSVNNVSITANPTNGAVFYRLVYP